jgi:hypothetical protein
LAEWKLADALSCLVHIPLAPEAIGCGLYASAALDATVSSWSSRNNKTKYIDGEKLKSLKAAISEVVGAHLGSETVADFSERFGSLGSPSALLKLKWFLQAIDVYPEEPTQEQEDRFKNLNIVRNAVVHSGTVRLNKSISSDALSRVAVAVILVMQEITAFYMCRYAFDMRDSLTEPMRMVIRDFFINGRFRGQRVFDEDYEEFLARAEVAWVEESRIEGLPLVKGAESDR